MRYLAMLTAAGLLASTAAYADTADGVVTGIDFDAKTVTLDDGHTYQAPDTAMIDELETGNHVTVTYAMKDGAMVVSEILQPEAGVQQ